ncbi:MAG: biotin transporter BioY [Rickettsiaceae bacterium]|nr:biotin transporter BioY [Rickettsiaceae bacterium]
MLVVAKKNILSEAIQITLGILVLAICSQITINIKPVPITLQSLWVIAIPFIYQGNKSLAVISGYLLLGALGLPVFAKWSSGLSYLVNPAGGYYLGFLASVFVMNLLKTRLNIFFTCALGQTIIYFFGISWLSKFLGVNKAIELGLIPFIIPGLVKTVILVGLFHFFKILSEHK